MDKKRIITWVVLALSIGMTLLFISIVSIERVLSGRIPYEANPKKWEKIVTQRERLLALGARPVTFTTPDGIAIAGLLLERKQAKRIFVICHGFKHTKERMADLADIFPEDTLVLIDFRGQGESSGTKVCLGLQEHLDIIAACQYAKKHISDKLPLIGIGVSQGGAGVLRAAAYGAPFDVVISDSAPSDFKYTVATILQRGKKIPFPIGWLALTWYEYLMGCSYAVSDYRTYAHKITCPVLIMHDRKDHLINYCHAEKLYNALGSSCRQLWTVDNTWHGKMFKQIPTEYKQKIEDFIAKCVD